MSVPQRMCASAHTPQMRWLKQQQAFQSHAIEMATTVSAAARDMPHTAPEFALAAAGKRSTSSQNTGALVCDGAAVTAAAYAAKKQAFRSSR